MKILPIIVHPVDELMLDMFLEVTMTRKVASNHFCPPLVPVDLSCYARKLRHCRLDIWPFDLVRLVHPTMNVNAPCLQMVRSVEARIPHQFVLLDRIVQCLSICWPQGCASCQVEYRVIAWWRRQPVRVSGTRRMRIWDVSQFSLHGHLHEPFWWSLFVHWHIDWILAILYSTNCI